MIKIVTDYLASLPDEVAETYQIRRMPSYLIFEMGDDDEVLLEELDISLETFYDRLAADEYPATEPPEIQDFIECYQSIIDADPEAVILSIHLSGEMSDMILNAEEAAKRFPETAIHLFDSRTTGLAEGLMVHEAARMAQQNASPEAILAKLAHMRDTTRIFFLIDTLEYLAKGGRIGRAVHLVGATMKLKPMLTVHKGEVTTYARFTDREKAIASLRSLVAEVTKGQPNPQIGVTHSQIPEVAEQFAAELQEMVSPEVMLVGEVGATLGAHTGPGVLGAAWYIPPKE